MGDSNKNAGRFQIAFGMSIETNGISWMQVVFVKRRAGVCSKFGFFGATKDDFYVSHSYHQAMIWVVHYQLFLFACSSTLSSEYLAKLSREPMLQRLSPTEVIDPWLKLTTCSHDRYLSLCHRVLSALDNRTNNQNCLG